MKGRFIWLVMSCLVIPALLLVSCAPSVVEKEEESATPEEAATGLLPAPASFSVSNLSVQPLEVKPNEAVTITISVANTGGTDGSYTVVLSINGVEEAEKSVAIIGGNTKDVTFTIIKEETKTYNVEVDGLTASFTVVAPGKAVTPPPTPSPCPRGSPPAELIYYPRSGKSWSQIPSITIAAQANDNRIQLVYEAVDFWNQQLEKIGTPFRFGSVTQTIEIVPTDYLEAVSSAVLEGKARPDPPESVKNIPGDLIIVLSDGNFVSFGAVPGSKDAIVGIRNFKSAPLNLTNVGRNVIAHELGHAIGLGHNNDPTKLMAGRPSDIRPDAFYCDREHFFPLTEEEKAYLLELYPTTWKSTN